MPKHLLKIILIWIQILAAGHLEAGSHQYTVAAKGIKILAIGNSFTLNACRYLSDISSSAGDYNIRITTATIGGSSLEEHARLITACEQDDSIKQYAGKYTLRELLEKETYNFVTIQQVSSLSFKRDSYQPIGNILVEYIKKYAPSAQILIHQTWAYSPACPRLSKWEMIRDEMHTQLVKSYAVFAGEMGLVIIHSGQAYYEAFKKQPDIYLWKEDGYHANQNGEYLAGLVWFEKLFGVSPIKVNYVPEGIALKSAKYLRRIADKQIRKSN